MQQMPGVPDTPAPPRSPAGAYYLPAVAAALVTCAAVVVMHHQSIRTLVSAHGLLHTAIAQQFLDSWRTFGRPENPYFGGAPLPYYWFYHYVAARISAAAGIHPLIAFEVLGITAVTITWCAGAAIGRELRWSPAQSLAIGFLAFAGTNAFGACFLIVKLAAGRPWPADDGLYLWGLTHPVMGMARFNDSGALYGPLINFFMNNSSRDLALALSLLIVLAGLRFLRTGRGWTLAGLAASAAAATAMSPIIGLVASAAMAGVLICVWWSRGTAGAPWPAVGALVVGCLLPSPTYYHLFGQASGSGVVVGFRPDLLLTIVVSAGPLVALAIVGTLTEIRHRSVLLWIVVGSTGLLVATSLARIPGSNESNLFHVAGFLLAIPAAGAVRATGRWPFGRRRAVIAAGLLLFVSTPLVVLGAYWKRPAANLVLEGNQLRILPAGSERRAVYEWLRAQTPSNALLVVEPAILEEAVLGNVSDIPAMTGRRLFVAGEPDYLVNPNRDAGRRRQIATTLLAGESLSDEDGAYLQDLRRPIFIVRSIAGQELSRRMRAAHGAPVFSARTVAVYDAWE